MPVLGPSPNLFNFPILLPPSYSNPENAVVGASFDFYTKGMDQKAVDSVNKVDVDGSNSNNLPLDPVTQVRNLLFRRILIGIKDGRFFLGSFHCIDKQGNIILQDAVEYRSTRRSSPSPMEQRCLGLVLIPSSCRTSCHVDCSIEEQLSLLSLQQ